MDAGHDDAAVGAAQPGGPQLQPGAHVGGLGRPGVQDALAGCPAAAGEGRCRGLARPRLAHDDRDPAGGRRRGRARRPRRVQPADPQGSPVADVRWPPTTWKTSPRCAGGIGAPGGPREHERRWWLPPPPGPGASRRSEDESRPGGEVDAAGQVAGQRVHHRARPRRCSPAARCSSGRRPGPATAPGRPGTARGRWCRRGARSSRSRGRGAPRSSERRIAVSLQRRARTRPSRSATIRLTGSFAIVDCRPVRTWEAHS